MVRIQMVDGTIIKVVRIRMVDGTVISKDTDGGWNSYK